MDRRKRKDNDATGKRNKKWPRAHNYSRSVIGFDFEGDWYEVRLIIPRKRKPELFVLRMVKEQGSARSQDS